MTGADLVVYADELLTCSPGNSLKRGGAMMDVGLVRNGAVVVSDGRILEIGDASSIRGRYMAEKTVETIMAMPCLVDAHTHPIFAGSRIHEYEMRAQGASYLEIMESGGGIAGTVRATRKASDEELFNSMYERLTRMLKHGTGWVEAKSGYGLSLEEELRQLRIIRRVGESHPVGVVSTFLGAHAVPEEYAGKRGKYVDLVCNGMIPAVAEEGLADFVDVFCEDGAFDFDETERIFNAAIDKGLKIRIHSEQFKSSGASLKAAMMGAYSCDHLLGLSVEDAKRIADYDTVCMFLPSSEFFLNTRKYGLMREAIDCGAAVGLATDFNAGSCLSESLPMTMSIAVIQMKIHPEEAVLAATSNAAWSIGKGAVAGCLEPGRPADILCVDCGYREWLYHFGVNMISGVVKGGKLYV